MRSDSQDTQRLPQWPRYVPWILGCLLVAAAGWRAVRHQGAAGSVRHYGGEVNGAFGSWVHIGPDADLANAVAALDGLWKTEGLFISHPAFDDAMVASLPRFPCLRLADFPGTALTDAGAMAMAAKGYPLQRVDLSDTKVTERGAAALRAAAGHASVTIGPAYNPWRKTK